MKFKNEYLFGTLLLILVINLSFKMFKTFEGFANDSNTNENHIAKNKFLAQHDSNNNINLMDSYSSPQSLISGNTQARPAGSANLQINKSPFFSSLHANLTKESL